MTQPPDANLIQMYCDGECTAEQSALVERHLAGDLDMARKVQMQKQFNASLKSSLVRSAGGLAAPEGMREHLKAMFDRAADAPTVAGRIETAPARKRNIFAAIFEDPRRGNVLAIAATLLIVAGAVLYGIFGRSIDDVTPPSPNDVFAKAALFAEIEHGQCAGDESTLSKKTQLTSIAEAQDGLTKWLDTPVRVTNLSSLGYEFAGAGQCNLPTTARSGHIMYRKSGVTSGPTPMVSVFVFPNCGQCGGNLCKGMNCHQWYDCGNKKCTHRVLRSTDGHLVYLLVCCADGEIDDIKKVISDDLHQGSQ